jgi:hypothetical protein
MVKWREDIGSTSIGCLLSQETSERAQTMNHVEKEHSVSTTSRAEHTSYAQYEAMFFWTGEPMAPHHPDCKLAV